MHGNKKKLEWGNLNERIACALIFTSDIVNKLYDNKTLFVWDPFCGSGGIVIESFLLATERQIRPVKEITNEAFLNIPFHDNAEFGSFIDSEKSYSQNNIVTFRRENTDLHFIASDSDSKSIDSLFKNSEATGLTKFKIKCGDNYLYADTLFHQNLNSYIYHKKINNVFNSFIGDFETIGREVIFNNKLPFHLKKFTIFSNIPYGTSQDYSAKIDIKSTYKRFGKFLRKYSDLFEDVFILVNKTGPKDELNFKNLSEIKWEVICSFQNNGIDVEFIKMKKSI
jgi:23S rRNA G2445 N2-methylase RlmL